MKNIVLRQKSVVNNLQWILFTSPLFFFYPLLLLCQMFFASADFLGAAGAAIWVCFLPPLYIAILGGQFLSKIVLTDKAVYVGPYSSEHKLLSDLVEVGGENGSILNGFREGITLKFRDDTEEILYLDEYEESELRNFLNSLKKRCPDCSYTYSNVIPLESRGLIKFIYQTSQADNLIVKQTKTPIEDAIFQLVKEHKRTFFSLYLAGWMLVVVLFTGLTVSFDDKVSDDVRINEVGVHTYRQIKEAFPDSFKDTEIDTSMLGPNVEDVKEGHLFESLLVKAILVAMASAYYFSVFGLTSLFLIWSLIGFVLLVVVPVIRKYSPNFVFLDGKTVGQGTRFLPWEKIYQVELQRNGDFADPMDGKLKLNSDSNSTAIKLDRIPDQNTRMKLLRLVERHAINAKFNEEFLRTTVVSSDIQFTDMWLDESQKGVLSPEEEERATAVSEGANEIGSGRFVIKQVLGYGGQGTTYLAEPNPESVSEKLPQEVVVKELVLPTHADVRIIQDARLRFNNGAELLSQIEHNQIVSHFEHFIEGANAYLVMEYVPGKTLRELVTESGPLEFGKVIDVARQILGILDYLHTLPSPVIHCDLAPDNLILTDSGDVKLIDFDVARVDGKGASAVVAARPAYTPPEQFRGKPVIESDIYAFGAIVQFLSSGQDPAPLSESLNSDDSDMSLLQELVSKCCQFDASDRLSSAKLVLEELEKVSSEPAKIFLSRENDSVS